MTVSSDTAPVRKGKTPQEAARFKGFRSWSILKRDAEALKGLLESRRPRFLPGMLKLLSFFTYFRPLLQDQRVMAYLVANHGETLKKLETTLAYLQRQADAGEWKTIDMWTVAEARKQLETLISEARHNEPQVIGVYKTSLVTIVSSSRWKAIVRRYPDVEQLARPSLKLPPMPAVRKSTVNAEENRRARKSKTAKAA